jgi:hypothetical protein
MTVETRSVVEKRIGCHRQKMDAYLANGVALPGDLDALQVEIISAEQQEETLLRNRKTYLEGCVPLRASPTRQT